MQEDHGYSHKVIDQEQTVHSGVSLPSVTWRSKARHQGDKLRFQPHEALPDTMYLHFNHAEPQNLQIWTRTLGAEAG
jgi:hypothetical protein